MEQRFERAGMDPRVVEDTDRLIVKGLEAKIKRSRRLMWAHGTQAVVVLAASVTAMIALYGLVGALLAWLNPPHAVRMWTVVLATAYLVGWLVSKVKIEEDK